MSERNEDNTDWFRPVGMIPTSGFNKMKTEDMSRVRKRKDLFPKEVELAKRRKKLSKTLFTVWNGKKCLSHHKWMLLTDDTVSVTPVRYQKYVITLKLTPKKDDFLHQTFGILSKTQPQVWMCCANYSCMTGYDVSKGNDTQKNVHLDQHHLLGVTPPGHSKGKEGLSKSQRLVDQASSLG